MKLHNLKPATGATGREKTNRQGWRFGSRWNIYTWSQRCSVSFRLLSQAGFWGRADASPEKTSKIWI